MKFIKTFLFAAVAFLAINFVSSQNILGVIKADALASDCATGTTWNEIQWKCNPPTGLLGDYQSNGTCIIQKDKSTCQVSFWAQVRDPISGANTILDTSPVAGWNKTKISNSGQYYADIPFGDTIFYLYHNNVKLYERTAYATCISGTVWDSTNKKCITSSKPSGELEANNAGCSIYENKNNCLPPDITWRVYNPISNGVVSVTRSDSASTTITNTSTVDMGNGVTRISGKVIDTNVIPFGDVTYYLNYNGVQISKMRLNAHCNNPSGAHVWNITNQRCESVTAELKTTSTSVSSGESATLSWTSNNATWCSLHSNLLGNAIVEHGLSNTGFSTGALASKAIFFLDCQAIVSNNAGYGVAIPSSTNKTAVTISIIAPNLDLIINPAEGMNYHSDSLLGHVKGVGYSYQQSIKNDGSGSIPNTTKPKHLFQVSRFGSKPDGTFDFTKPYDQAEYLNTNDNMTFSSAPTMYLPSGQTRLIDSVSITSDKDYFFIRLCADKSSGFDSTGVVAETNISGTGETNNCGSWERVNFSEAPSPDIQASAISLYKDNGASMTAVAGIAQDYYSTISNTGNAATNYKGVVTFKNLFQTTSGFDFTNGSIDYNKPNNLVNYGTSDALSKVSRVLSAAPGTNDGSGNMSNAAQVAKSISFANQGDQWIRVCADKDSVTDVNGVIVELSETNNCGAWSKITVSQASDVYKINVTKYGDGEGIIKSGTLAVDISKSTLDSYINCGNDCSEDIANLPDGDPAFAYGKPIPQKIITMYPVASKGSYFGGWDSTDWVNAIEVFEGPQTHYIATDTKVNSEASAIFNLNRKPRVATEKVLDITETSATAGGTIISRNGSDVTVSGIVWSENMDPTLSDNKTTDGSVGRKGTWRSNMTGLKKNTIYHVRAYATNEKGTGYGNDVVFNNNTASPSGSLIISPSNCKIAVNNSTCTVSGAKWNTTNAVSPALIDGNTGTVLSNLADNNTSLMVWVAYPQTVFNLQDGILPLDSKIVTAMCENGTGWDSINNKCAVLSTDSLDGMNCEIKKDQSTCKTIMTLNIASPVVGAETNVTTNIPVFNTEVIKNKDIGSFPSTQNGIVVNYPDTTFFLNHNTLTVAEKTLKATCELGTTWNVASDKCTETIIIDSDGVWGESTYGSCGGCDVSGDNGTQTVNRSCVGPFGNGKQCVGLSSYSQSCSCKGGSGLISLFTASPEKIYKGRYTTLDWDSNADACSITDNKGVTLDTKNKKKGNVEISPVSTTNYNLTCSKSGVTETKQIEVKVINVKIIEG